MNKETTAKVSAIGGIALLIYIAVRFVIQGLVMGQLELYHWHNEMWVTAIALILLFGGAYFSKKFEVKKQ